MLGNLFSSNCFTGISFLFIDFFSSDFSFLCSTEHELEDQVNEWANMTGFLVALGGVCLQRKSPAGLRGFDHSKKSTG
jgi:hypothetical protein